MMEMTTRRRSSPVEVLKAQLILLGRSTRPWLLLVVVATTWAVVVVHEAGTTEPWSALQMLEGEWYVLMLIVGAVWGVLTWHDEGPKRRVHHWRMPLDVSVHDALRVSAAALWLCLAVTLFLALAGMMAAASGELGVMLSLNPLVWLNYYTAALLGFLILAAATTASARGLEWTLLLSAVLLALVLELVSWGQGHPRWLDPLARLLEAVFFGEYGFLTAVGAMGPPSRIELMIDPNSVVNRSIGLSAWLGATMVWLGAGVLAFAGATAWHRRR